MFIVDAVATQLNQEYRRACYHALATNGFLHPDLYFERKNENYYMSYWGSGNRRAEVIYDPAVDSVFVYELKFVP